MLENLKFTAAEILYKPNFIKKSKDLIDLDQNGILVIPNFISPARADELVEKMKQCYLENPNLVKKESNGFDERIYGADLFTNFKLPELNKITDEYACNFYFPSTLYSFLLMGKIFAGDGNLGSGSGWHRDSPITHQFKGIIYLTDVSESNGPFQYVEGSHKWSSIKSSLKRLNADCNKRRFENSEVDNLINENFINPYKSYTGKKGTLILVNTRGLHRGAPIIEGTRYAITRYFSTKPFKKDFFI